MPTFEHKLRVRNGGPCGIPWHKHIASAINLALGYHSPDPPPKPSGQGDSASAREWESDSTYDSDHDPEHWRRSPMGESTLWLDYIPVEPVTEVYFV